MLRIRTLYNLGFSFSLRNIDFDYGFNGETTYTEYGYVVGYSNIETLNGQSFYSLNSLLDLETTYDEYMAEKNGCGGKNVE